MFISLRFTLEVSFFLIYKVYFMFHLTDIKQMKMKINTNLLFIVAVSNKDTI